MNGSPSCGNKATSLNNIPRNKRSSRVSPPSKNRGSSKGQGKPSGSPEGTNGQETGANGNSNQPSKRKLAKTQGKNWKAKTHTKSGAVTAALISGLQQAQGENDALKDLIAGPMLDLTNGTSATSSTTTSCIGTTITIGGGPPTVTTTTTTPNNSGQPTPAAPVVPAAPPPQPSPQDLAKKHRDDWKEEVPTPANYKLAFDQAIDSTNQAGWKFSFETPDPQTMMPYWAYLLFSYFWICVGLAQTLYTNYQTFAAWLLLKTLAVYLTYYLSKSLKEKAVGPVGLLVTLGINTFFGFMTRHVLGVDSYAVPMWFSVAYWSFITLLYLFGLNAYPFPERMVRHKYKLDRDGFDTEPQHDNRQDVMSLGKMEHSRPLRAKMVYTRSGLYFSRHDGRYIFFGRYKPQKLQISGELFVQLTNPRILQHGSSEEENSRHLNRQAAALHSVNIDKYGHFENNDVYGDTVLVAYGYLQHIKQKRQDCPFYRAPLVK